MKKKLTAALLALALCLLTAAGVPQRPGPVALTFDDGPSSKYTQVLLDGLAARGVQVTFFVMGNSLTDQHGDIVVKNADIVRRAADEGHQIASHSYSHPNLTQLTDEEILAELALTDSALERILGPGEVMVRPPYGFAGLSPRVQALIDRPIILWSIDPAWEAESACEEDMVRCIVDRARDGDIILLHDFKGMDDVNAALRAIDILQVRGYSFVTVARLMELKGVTPAPGQVYRRFPQPPAGAN